MTSTESVVYIHSPEERGKDSSATSDADFCREAKRTMYREGNEATPVRSPRYFRSMTGLSSRFRRPTGGRCGGERDRYRGVGPS
ncbi:hypothetical protein CYV19_05965 [Natronobacterium gregoryi SP2]|uniref:Uncharacterized protein n=1 Tax=Natronobacterium gregoryi (strain ATCC 43098 / DSM 3393 / CCM 3738 / CIP 104747 / IAM 13177 / JCM 8860 / NBRC 102187 / NCIMB 2189 / SP2) TaxID=797304 RepID=L9Y5S3_NATGS|nr:hypothetical protein C490_07744 [Natronobacterium gregoryi SP2]PLK21175.1 hypothetical protein CYV19_05965 [Natronobacterium gregoryi SP2]